MHSTWMLSDQRQAACESVDVTRDNRGFRRSPNNAEPFRPSQHALSDIAVVQLQHLVH